MDPSVLQKLESDWHTNSLTEDGTDPQLPTQPKNFVHCINSWVAWWKKMKFEPEEKKFSLILKIEICGLKTSTNRD